MSAVQKPKLPALFKKLLNEMSTTMETNMISGFKACGIVPLNRENVKKKLQFNEVEVVPENEDIIQFLREQRGISVPAAISADRNADAAEPVAGPSRTLQRRKPRQPTKPKPLPGKPITPRRELETENDVLLVERRPVTALARGTSFKKRKEINNNVSSTIVSLAVGDCVILKFMARKKEVHYAGVITDMDVSDIQVNYLKSVNENKN